MATRRGLTDSQIVKAKLVKAKRLVVRGLTVDEAAERYGLTRSQIEPVATREAWVAQRNPGLVDLPELDVPLEREVFGRQAYELVRIGIERLHRDDEIKLPQFASTLETLVKVGRLLLGMESAQSGAQLTVLARNAIVTA